MNYKKYFSMTLLVALVCGMAAADAYATRYFYYDAEGGVIGNNIPTAADRYDDNFYCHSLCGGSEIVATVENSGGAPQGSKYYQWNAPAHTHSVRVDVKNINHFSAAAGNLQLTVGATYYMAYWINMDRNGSDDLYKSGSHVNSYDKDGQLCDGGCTTSSSVSWSSGHGQISGCYDSFSGNTYWMANRSGFYTNWLGNTNKDPQNNNFGDTLGPNQNGYTCGNSYQMAYDTWHSVVVAIKMTCDNTGRIQMWVDGILTHDYNNIITVDYEDDGVTCDPEISKMSFGGTIDQPDYDVASHLRKYDALMLTNDWQDIIDGGYLGGQQLTSPEIESINLQ